MQITNTPIEAEIERMYWDGLNDREISEALSVSRETVTKWRSATKNPPNGILGRPPQRYQVYFATTNTLLVDGTATECAMALSVSRHSFYVMTSMGSKKYRIVKLEAVKQCH